MFKGILSKRTAFPEFSMIYPSDPECPGKENSPPHSPRKLEAKRTVSVAQVKDVTVGEVSTDKAFERLLDDLQIPSALRPKLVNMDSTVKAAMLKSSHVMPINLALTASESQKPATPKIVRKSHSSDSLVSPKSSADLSRPPQVLEKCESQNPSANRSGGFRFPTFHMRGKSVDAVNKLNTTTAGDLALFKGGKDKEKTPSKNMSPATFISILSGTSSTVLEVEVVKKLRLLLRNESASWSQEFLRLGGYSVLLTRLSEILEVEWREEQHDDQILHEFLLCFKALSTSSIGCFALRSSCPTPFVQLMSLLYSDKKPGDVATRQLIADLLLILFDLYPSSSPMSPAAAMQICRRETPSTPPGSDVIDLPYPHTNIYSLLRALLLTPAPPPSESPSTPITPLEFIDGLHRPRIYKTYLGELSDLCRDYFWVFCHPGNHIWALGRVDQAKAEAPRAPGAMTGGVECEAMTYMTTHFKLINAITDAAENLGLPKEHELSVYQFHVNLWLSGLDRIVPIARRASTVYYPKLHLEIARYIAAAIRVGYELPWAVNQLIGPPPTAYASAVQGQRTGAQSSPNRYAQRQGKSMAPPKLPFPTKVEPIRF